MGPGEQNPIIFFLIKQLEFPGAECQQCHLACENFMIHPLGASSPLEVYQYIVT